MGRKIYDPAWRKELAVWMNFPHTFAMSEAMRLYAAQNRHKPKLREPKMCQACGAVSIVGGDRLIQASENAHAAFYCDRECAESDRGRVYRTSPKYQAKVDARCEREGKNRGWQNEVCVVHYRECKVCNVGVCCQYPRISFCSEECRKIDHNVAAWIAHRKTQTPREVQCAGCGIAFSTLTRTNADNHYCSKLCVRRQVRRMRRHTEREKTSRAFRKKLRAKRGVVSLQSQYQKFKGLCQLCGCKTEMLKQYEPHQASVDHIVPLSKGGLHVEGNLQLACIMCNSKKADVLPDGKQLLLY